MKLSRIIISITLIIALTAATVVVLIPKNVPVDPVSESEASWAYDLLKDTLNAGRYTYRDFLGDNKYVVTPQTKIDVISEGDTLVHGGESAIFKVNVPSDGLYSFALDTFIVDKSFTSLAVSVLVNGELQYNEAISMNIPIIWRDESKDFPLDKFGDETAPLQEVVSDWFNFNLYANTYTSHLPNLFKLEEGENTIEIVNNTSRSLEVGTLTVNSDFDLTPYSEYIASHSDKKLVDTLIKINSIDYSYKNSSFAQLASTNNPSVQPSDPVNRKLNILQISEAGTEVFFKVSVPEDGLYEFAVHYMTGNEDFANFCSLKINGEIPFAEAASFSLEPHNNSRWHYQVWQDTDGNPYYIYLPAGEHTISLRMELDPVAQALRNLQLLVDHINQFSIDIIKVTGKDIDRNRTWRLTRFLPETADYLDAYDIILRDIAISLSEFSPKGINSSMLSTIIEALAILENLREKPDELPLHMESLSGQDVSVLKLSGDCMDRLLVQSMDLSAIYIYSNSEDKPPANAGILKSLGGSIARIWASYTSPKYVVRNQDDVINIWINDSILHVDTLQKLVDTRFTPETGIAVNLSVMPDPNRLILARAAGTNPDIALSLEAYRPFDLASRGSLHDLTQFDDFWQVASQLAPGAFSSYVYDEGVYALPQTISFNTLVYREDIFRQLGLDPPDTWADVTKMMSELQRFDMNFYMPIASGTGYKWFHQTSPLIYQNNGTLYQEDGLGTTINQPEAVRGLTFLGELFTTYALAEQVPVFYNSFRLGQTPVGIIDSDTYILLTRGAPELKGQWSLAPYPGTVQEDGSISRWYIANGRGAVIFENTDMLDECWEFLKWWVSEDTQTEYAFIMQANYGILWLSSNLNALANAPIEDRDLEIILDSIQWMRDVPRSPGQYMLERSLSDIWNTIVFDGTPAQVAIDMYSIEIQREFRRKMTEAGFIDSLGNPIVEYRVRELDWILEKIEAAKNK